MKSMCRFGCTGRLLFTEFALACSVSIHGSCSAGSMAASASVISKVEAGRSVGATPIRIPGLQVCASGIWDG